MDMENKEKQNIELPENAFRELKEGEEYQPVMSPNKVYPEVSTWSVTWGLVMVVLFSAAAAYLGLKVGQVFEAAIPIAIIAIGMSSATKRKNALGENVIIQSIGACSGAVVAGGIFVMPAIYMLELQADFFQIFIAAALGGILGILFLIPFRKYFVKEQHGKYPFPEATATTQVLVSGEKGGSQAKPLLLAGLVGGLYDFSVATFGWWNETVTSRMIGFGETIADKAQGKYWCGYLRFGLHHRSEICLHYLYGLARSVVVDSSRNGSPVPRYRAEPMGPKRGCYGGQYVGRRDFQELRSFYRYRRYCHVRRYRHRKVVGHHQKCCQLGFKRNERQRRKPRRSDKNATRYFV